MKRGKLHTCVCCGFAKIFEDGEAAFKAGWDAPPYFSQYVSCDLCPGVCCMGMDTHDKAHALWEKLGRPKEFTLDMCAGDSIINNPGKMKASNVAMRKIRNAFKNYRREQKRKGEG